MVVICSTDGYLSFVRFPEGALGEPLDDQDIPLIVKQSNSCVYNYNPPRADVPSTENEEEMKDQDKGECPEAPTTLTSGTPHKIPGEKTVDGNENKLSNEIPSSTINKENVNNQVLENGEDKKKRKRITPINIAPVGTKVNYVVVTSVTKNDKEATALSVSSSSSSSSS